MVGGGNTRLAPDSCLRWRNLIGFSKTRDAQHRFLFAVRAINFATNSVRSKLKFPAAVVADADCFLVCCHPCPEDSRRNFSACQHRCGDCHDCQMVKKDLAAAFGAVLRQHRQHKSITQEKLSERADVDVRMIRMVERGTRNPSVNLADSLAHGLGVSLSQLITEAEQLRRKKR